MPDSEAGWRDLLLALTPDWPGGEAWSLVVDDWTRPALVQPPLVRPENRADYKSRLLTPDALDMLVTSRNHDVKAERITASHDEDWLFGRAGGRGRRHRTPASRRGARSRMARARRLARWQLLAHVAAVLSGTSGAAPHAPSASFGRALHAAGYSEHRLMRLTAARGPALSGQIVRAARYLAQARQVPVNLWAVRDLSSAEHAEAARLKIARDYYAAHHASGREDP